MATNPDTRLRVQTALAEDEALELGIEAYIYGYPLVLADVTKRVMTLGADSAVCARAPLNRFAHLRALPGHNFTDVVSPNADTLYSTAWLSLAREPVILSLPEMGQRYFVMTVMDGWSNVLASPGTRTIGTGGWHFAIVGPRWKGTLPAGVSPIEAPTNLVWIIGRTETSGPDDCAAAHAVQDQYALTPLHDWGRLPQAPPPLPHQLGVDTTTPPAQQVSRMEARTFFSRLNYLMRDNPPALADAPVLARVSAIGVAPGEPFEWFDFSPSTIEALERSTKAGQAVLVAESRMPAADRVNGWHWLPAHTGAFGTDYTRRAAVALTAFGANVPADCTYAQAAVDSTNESLTGRHRYEITFPHGQLPPVNAFWSISLYNTRYAVIANPVDRHAIGSRDPLIVGPDGSTTLYIQRDPPLGERARNWLPAPEGSFNLVSRLYWPRPEILGGGWKLPAVARIG